MAVLHAMLGVVALGGSRRAAGDACEPITIEFREIAGVRVERVVGEPAVVEFTAGMAIDADGAPRAYHPDDVSGLDGLAHAGAPGDWWALATDADGAPFVQGEDDPAPGFHVSTTSLVDASRAVRDPRRSVDASAVPYVALPPVFTSELGCRLGDVAWVERTARDGTVHRSAAVFADVSPATAPLGEGSIALAERLAIPSDARTGGTYRASVRYAVFCGSGVTWPSPVAAIDAAGERLEGSRIARDARACPRR